MPNGTQALVETVFNIPTSGRLQRQIALFARRPKPEGEMEETKHRIYAARVIAAFSNEGQKTLTLADAIFDLQLEGVDNLNERALLKACRYLCGQ